MKTREQIKDIQEVVLYILNKFVNGVDYIKLFKIMYFAQKDYLSNYGMPLCPDTFRARTFGPVPALSSKVIKMVEHNEMVDESSDLMDFCNSISVVDKKVFANVPADSDNLAVKQMQILDKWYDYCKDKDSKTELSPESHDDAYMLAYERCVRDPQLSIMTNMEIAKAGGATADCLAYIHDNEIFEAAFC